MSAAGTSLPFGDVRAMTAIGGKADMRRALRNRCECTHFGHSKRVGDASEPPVRNWIGFFGGPHVNFRRGLDRPSLADPLYSHCAAASAAGSDQLSASERTRPSHPFGGRTFRTN